MDRNIISIEGKIPRLLHELIEAGGSSKVAHKIGEAGARIVIEGYEEKGIHYRRELVAFSEKTGIPLSVLEGKVDFMYVAEPGKKEVDGIMKIKEDVVVDKKVVFKKGEVIAIIKAESTVREVDLEKVWGDMHEGTFEDLKEHIKLDSYKNVPYGIAIGFSYNPVDVLIGDKSSLGIKSTRRAKLKIWRLKNERKPS
ncbi:MAG: hypothetical protein N3F08_03520 [Crenarchaeota archaeon]|nr:hypothetical protein [Thermoproteota archaeon]